MKPTLPTSSMTPAAFASELGLSGTTVAFTDDQNADRRRKPGGCQRESAPQCLLTLHAQSRMSSRHISEEAVQATLDYGRSYRTGGARLFRLGRREIDTARRDGLDLSPHEGVHVILSNDGRVITTWRCRNLRRLWR